MTTDFRALCAELVDAWDTARTPSHFIDTADQSGGVIDKLRTALAEPDAAAFRPASLSPDALEQWDKAEAAINASMARVRTLAAPARAALAEPEPEGAPVWTEGICGDGAALLRDGVMVPIEEVVQELNEGSQARVVLDRWGRPAPQPADGEVAELVAWLREEADDYDCIGETLASPKCRRAADLLERLSPPQPIPVSERLPGPGDCDAEGRCWLCGKVEGDWRLLNPEKSGVPQLKYCFSHWLPAHALPVPS